jgi:glutathione S-transferase
MYQLYYSPGACSLAVHAILNELGQPFELINVSIQEGKNRDPQFLKLNPRAQVPVLVEEGFVMREGGAILIYLLEKHSSPMLPKSGHERATALEWLLFANASMHPAYGKMFFFNKALNDQSVKDQLMGVTAEQISKMWKEVDDRLADRSYVCGNECSAADILLSVFANWNNYFPNQQITLGDNVKRMLKAVVSRPAYQKALQAEKVQYKAAA